MISRIIFFRIAALFILPYLVHSATLFTLTNDKQIVCSDSFDNVCTAPTSCNANGKADFDAGDNFNVGATETRNKTWTIVGGYTIKFPSTCLVKCSGSCTCDGCESVQIEDSLERTTNLNESSALALSVGSAVTAFWLVTVLVFT